MLSAVFDFLFSSGFVSNKHPSGEPYTIQHHANRSCTITNRHSGEQVILPPANFGCIWVVVRNWYDESDPKKCIPKCEYRQMLDSNN